MRTTMATTRAFLGGLLAASALAANADAQTPPARVDAGSAELGDVAQISAGSAHTCARRTSGTVVCWGYNEHGTVGDGTSGTNRLTPVAVAGLTDAVEISAGGAHTCARRASGAVVCWGNNDNGRLGDGTTTMRPRPVAVSGLTDAVEISAGTAHTCARRRSGAVVCWGSNDHGQLGSDPRARAGCERGCSLMPTLVSGLSDAVQIVSGMGHTCARRGSGAVVCWGQDEPVEPGASRSGPVVIGGLTDAAQLAMGGSHSCARRATGAVVCWGANTYGQQGNGLSSGESRDQGHIGGLQPVAPRAPGEQVTVGPVTDLGDAADLAAGANHTCARRTSGVTVCWGGNYAGQLGDGSLSQRLTPVAVTGLTDAVQVSAGGGHTCARRPSGTAVCWGDNQYGQLGDGTVTARRVPVVVIASPASARDPF